jgi:hypothetical protein
VAVAVAVALVKMAELLVLVVQLNQQDKLDKLVL